ncbi:unnamed protein product, partial [Nesidiocoris tenuis]
MTKKKMMRCRALLIRCARGRCCAVLLIVCVILAVGRLYQHRRYQLVMFRRSAAVDYELAQNDTRGRHFVPGAFLGDAVPRNVSYCRFRFGLPDVLNVEEADVAFTPELGEDSDYRVIYDVLEPPANETSDDVTFCTHATPEFLYYVVEILRRWQGPVSIATFVPSSDASLTLCLVERLCSCVPEMGRLSLHFVFPLAHPPRLVPCPAALAADASCAAPKPLASRSLQTFRNSEAMTYPVNVARNVARFKSRTKYTLVADVELFPSRQLVPRFLRMVAELKATKTAKTSKTTVGLDESADRIVYVVPVFEVGPAEDVPDRKSKLLEMYAENKAFYFH